MLIKKITVFMGGLIKTDIAKEFLLNQQIKK